MQAREQATQSTLIQPKLTAIIRKDREGGLEAQSVYYWSCRRSVEGLPIRLEFSGAACN